MKKLLTILPLVLLLCFTFGCQKAEEVTEEKEAEPTIIVDNAISADGVSIAYEVRGKGKPALVFVHGWGNNRSFWDTQVAHFSQKYTIVTIDLAGFGDSGTNREKWTMESFGDDVVAVLDKLNLKNVILIGFSMGGPVVIEASERIPEYIIGLVLVDTLQNIETIYSQEDISNIYKYFMGMVTEPSFEKLEPLFKKNKDELIERLISITKEDVSRVGWSESLRDIFRWSNEECIKSLQKIQAPVISINSDQEPTNVEAFKKHVPSFEAKIIPGVGHVVFWEAPDEFNRLLEEAVQEFIQIRDPKISTF